MTVLWQGQREEALLGTAKVQYLQSFKHSDNFDYCFMAFEKNTVVYLLSQVEIDIFFPIMLVL